MSRLKEKHKLLLHYVNLITLSELNNVEYKPKCAASSKREEKREKRRKSREEWKVERKIKTVCKRLFQWIHNLFERRDNNIVIVIILRVLKSKVTHSLPSIIKATPTTRSEIRNNRHKVLCPLFNMAGHVKIQYDRSDTKNAVIFIWLIILLGYT